MQQFIDNKVFYAFIDKTHKFSTHVYKADDDTSVNEVETNIRNVEKFLDVDKLFLINQVHGDEVYILDQDTITDFIPIADGVITKRTNVALAIQTADCVPVLISDATGGCIAALHCGWKSAISDMIGKTVNILSQMSSNRLYKAIVGPCIMQESYEVDNIFFQTFVDNNANNSQFFRQHGAKYMFDLPSYVITKLNQNGIDNIHFVGENTYTHDEKYFSYRRNTHQHIVDRKRILSVIVIKD